MGPWRTRTLERGLQVIEDLTGHKPTEARSSGVKFCQAFSLFPHGSMEAPEELSVSAEDPKASRVAQEAVRAIAKNPEKAEAVQALGDSEKKGEGLLASLWKSCQAVMNASLSPGLTTLSELMDVLKAPDSGRALICHRRSTFLSRQMPSPRGDAKESCYRHAGGKPHGTAGQHEHDRRWAGTEQRRKNVPGNELPVTGGLRPCRLPRRSRLCRPHHRPWTPTWWNGHGSSSTTP